jgi:hypothetical protein
MSTTKSGAKFFPLYIVKNMMGAKSCLHIALLVKRFNTRCNPLKKQA